MNQQNPYLPPATDLPADTASIAVEGNVTPLMVQHLSKTKLWVRVISVLLFVGTGITVLMSISMFAMAMAGAGNLGKGALTAGAGSAMGVMYLAFAVLYIPPAIFLHRYAGAIENVKRGGGSEAVEAALDHQRSFWKFSGIMSLVGIGLFVLGILAAIIIPVFAAVSSVAK